MIPKTEYFGKEKQYPFWLKLYNFSNIYLHIFIKNVKYPKSQNITNSVSKNKEC